MMQGSDHVRTSIREKRAIRLGICGLGRAFSLMLPTFVRDDRLQLVGACDPRGSARFQFASEFGVPVYQTIDELAASSDVEAIYIASPHQLHAEQTQIAAARGKHVLVEKPMALTTADCKSMIDACRTANVSLIVGHCHSFNTPYRHAREIIQSGELGHVRMIHALNYTDFLYRPRRPDELDTAEGGGAVFSQAAHQIDVVRLLAGSRANRVRGVTGAWDPRRPTEGAYSALLWFEDGAFASLTYSGYAHFDSDEWCDWIGEMGNPKSREEYGSARRRLAGMRSAAEEAQLKASGTYGGQAYRQIGDLAARAGLASNQHFGPIVVSCDRGDIRPLPDAIWVYGDQRRERRELPAPTVPRFEVIDELYDAIIHKTPPIHDGRWALGTLEICLALLQSAKSQSDVPLGAGT